MTRWLRRRRGNSSRLAALLTPEQLARLERDWPVWARETQAPPLAPWRTWLMLGGRGAGKTRTGAEWLHGLAMGDPHFPGDAAGRVALVAETYGDARAVMIEGESGLLSVAHPRDRPQWSPSLRQLYWPATGAVGQVFSAADPEGLRGFQFGACWADVIAVCAALASTFGIAIDAGSQAAIADAAVQIVGAVGALVAIYGRLTATRVIV